MYRVDTMDIIVEFSSFSRSIYEEMNQLKLHAASLLKQQTSMTFVKVEKKEFELVYALCVWKAHFHK